MSVHARWRWGAGALVVLAFALVSGSHLCGVALDETASDPGMRPIGGGGLACAEFWLSRYQTLFAALIAFTTAVIALHPARGQLKEVNRQSEMTYYDMLQRRHQSISGALIIYEDVAGLTNGAHLCARRILVGLEAKPAIARDLVMLMHNLESQAAIIMVNLEDKMGPVWGDEQIQVARRTFVRNSRGVQRGLQIVSRRLGKLTSLSIEEQEISVQASARILSVIMSYCDDIETHAETLTHAAEMELRRIEHNLRVTERIGLV